MKRLILFIVLICCPLICKSQEVIHLGRSHNPSTSSVPQKWKLPYALLSDSFLQNQDHYFVSDFVIFPTLILNDIVVENQDIVDRFRNTYDPKAIRFKVISKEKASKKGLPFSNDGTLIVTTKRKYHIVL